MAPQSLADRRAAVRDFVEAYTAARVDNPWEYDDSDLPEMYDDHRTVAEIEIVHDAADAGDIPSRLDTREKPGPMPISTYGVKCHVEEWQRSVEKSETKLRERLDEINGWDGTNKSNQWGAYRRYLRRAVEWLLGEHPEQTEGDE